VSREAPARFCERRRVRLPPPTLLVILVHGTREHAEALREDVAAVLAPLGLRLSEAKTQVVRMADGFNFLGYVEHAVMPRLAPGGWWPDGCVGGPRHIRGLFRAV
jgi:hypothetical protein